MANSNKNIVITPNISNTAQPTVVFTGNSNVPMTLRVADDNSLSFENSTGQLFLISNNVANGIIFSVSDISGIPSLQANSTGDVYIVPISGNVGIANSTPDATLKVTGNANVSGNLVVGGSITSVNVTASLFTGNVTGTASNATNLNSQPGSYYTNATNITTGTLAYDRLPANVVFWSNTNTFTAQQTFSSNVSLANTYINNVVSIGINTVGLTPGSQSPGTIYWSAAQQGAEVQLDTNVSGTINQDEFYYIKASAAITKGQLIAFSGTVGASGVVQGAPANTTLVTDPNYIMGIAAESISSGSFGYVQMLGTLRGFDTTGSDYGETWADGSILYYNPNYSGGLTSNTSLIQSPTPVVQVAAVINAGPGGSGSVLVRVTTRGKIRLLGDVLLSSPATGDTLVYNSSTSLWNNNPQSSLSVNNSVYFNGVSLSTVNSAITGNAGTAYTNSVSYVTAQSFVNTSQLSSNLSNYQTTADLAANVAVLAANSATYLGNSSGTIANVASWITGNSGTAYTNATSYVDGKSFVNSSQLSSNLNNYAALAGANFTGTVNGTVYQTGGGLGAAANGVYVNATSIFIGNSSVNTTINATSFTGTASNATNLDGQGATYYVANTYMQGLGYVNSTSGTAYNSSNLNGQSATFYVSNTYMQGLGYVNSTSGTAYNSSNLAGQAATYYVANTYLQGLGYANSTYTGTVNGAIFQTGGGIGAVANGIYANATVIFVGNSSVNATINATSFTGTSNNATNLGGVPSTSYVNTSGAYTITGVHTYSGNTVFSNWVNLKTYIETASAPTISASALTLDLSNSSVFNVNLNSSITTLTISNAPAAGNAVSGFVLIFTGDGTPRTVVWPSSTPNVRWANGTAPTITSTLNKRDVYVLFTTDNGSTYNAFISGQNI